MEDEKPRQIVTRTADKIMINTMKPYVVTGEEGVCHQLQRTAWATENADRMSNWGMSAETGAAKRYDGFGFGNACR